ncbi:glycosyltransferase family 4 protein [bacterium]|nr:glycosyltransferase family 4 protein [candidate division CSSED10-310 bacterium]
MKILFVVQRYGDSIVGGAEYHCRLIAGEMARNHTVEIATTCADDYLSWTNVYPEGRDIIDGITVHRFAVEIERPVDFEDLAFRILHGYSSEVQQERYVRDQGPYCPGLIRFLETRTDCDLFIFFSYRYWTTFRGLKSVGDRSILVPTAEHDRSMHLPVYRNTFHAPGSIAYNSPEERELIETVTGNRNVFGLVVGTGIHPQIEVDTESTLRKLDLMKPYMLYIGRIEQVKGCARLVGDYMRYFRGTGMIPDLVFAGNRKMDLPEHAGIRYLGILSEADKQAVLNGAVFLVIPSRYESLSMVVLEAWRARKPVICNGDCEVLRGQCLRSGGGLYYRNSDEFREAVDLMLHRADLREKMGDSGHRYFAANYRWDIIMEKYDILMNNVLRNRS